MVTFINSPAREAERLWIQIRLYDLDDPDSSLPFSKRLGSENGWSHDYALRVIKEYLKFIYLGMVAGHKVTPSDEVDQAWHLHMIYTEEYENFCKNILGKVFHHGPTKGGAKEDAKYKEWYEKTKQSYERIFGEVPPEDIWPSSEIRFGRRFIRLNVEDHLIIKKSDFKVTSHLVIMILNLVIKLKRRKRIC